MSDKFEFQIKRLVLVDSAGFCYVELPVDDHAILLGNGNLGKSSLLNSLRLFLLPENNFKNSKNKFAFATPKRDGYYDNEESYGHYFPSKFSYLILEASNNVGGAEQTHCQILHKSSGHLAYERIFTPLAYDNIRHLFWDGNDEADGIGFRVDDLSAAGLFKALKALDKNTISVKDPAKLKTLLYEKDFLSQAAMRYSIFPLAERDDARIESLRTLILLLFDMNASSEPVARAVANIIEADKKFVDDVLDFDIEQFLQKHDDLKAQDINLTRIENMGDKFHKLAADFTSYGQLADSEKQFAVFYAQLCRTLEQQIQAQAEKATARKTAQERDKSEGQQYKAFSDEHKKIEGALKQDQRRQNVAQQAVEKAESLLLSYPDMPLDEVLELIKGDIEDNTQRLQALESETQKAVRMNDLKNRIHKNRFERDKCQANIDNQHFSLEQQLPENTWQVLAALNKRLALANPQRELDESEIAAFIGFADRFEHEPMTVSIYNERFDKQNGSLKRNDEARISELEAQIHADTRELEQLEKGHANPINKANEVKLLEREVQQANQELSVIGDLEFNRKTVQSLVQPIKELEQQFAEVAQKLEQAEHNLNRVRGELNELNVAYSYVQKSVAKLSDLKSRCEHMITSMPRLGVAVKQTYSDAPPLALDNNGLNEISDNLIKVSELGNQLIMGLRAFISEQVIEDEHGVMAESPDRHAIKESFRNLEVTFANLQSRRNVLSEQVRTHNESVQGYANILQKNHQHIKRFEAQLNRDFAEVSINDLEGIEVDIHIDKRFENLVHDAAKLDLHSDSMLPDKFYDRLQSFANEFFKSGSNARLTMDKVINNLSYRTRKRDQAHWQTKQQSNSTTALINLKLVQILLSKLRSSGCSLMFPLVLDEVATVDVNQFDWLLDDIKQSGFNLFAASTHSASPELIYKIGRHHELGEMRTAKPYSTERALVYWGGAEGFSTIEEVEQLGIFEAVDEQTV